MQERAMRAMRQLRCVVVYVISQTHQRYISYTPALMSFITIMHFIIEETTTVSFLYSINDVDDLENIVYGLIDFAMLLNNFAIEFVRKKSI
jgi:hypothetical protein